MEDQWREDRGRLRELYRAHPTWRIKDFAAALNHSVGWVVKWLRRIRAAPDDEHVLHSHSRAPKRPQLGLSVLVLTAILTLRLHPPPSLRRTPGPKAILYLLQHDPELVGHDLPRSSRTVYRVLKAAHLIPTREPRTHQPLERPAPLTVWELDFKDNRFAQRTDDGKQQHMIEILVTIDTGTSLLLDLTVRDDFTAETALLAVAELVQRHGLPQVVRFDRDPRFVGSPQQGDFPAAFVRFWLCLGVQVDICEPQRPQDKSFVERLNRTLDEECLQLEQPPDLGTTRTAVETFLPYYNNERPHQGDACQNQPPAVAFPDLPTLPRVPELVDPDAWVQAMARLRLTRKVGQDGRISLNKQAYYVGKAHARQRVGLQIDAPKAELVVTQGGQIVKRLALKGLRRSGPIPFAQWVEELHQEARAEQRRTRTPRSSGRGQRASAGWQATLREALERMRVAEREAARRGDTATDADADSDDIPF